MDYKAALVPPQAEQLLASVLQTSDVDTPSSSRPTSETHFHYVERLKDRRVQLSNPDRKRPQAGGGDAKAALRAETKLSKRKRRVKLELAEMKKMRIERTRQARSEEARAQKPEKQRSNEQLKGKQRELTSIKKAEIVTSRKAAQSGAGAGKGKKIDKGAKKPLTRTERKRLGLEEVDANVSYELMLPLHRIWCSYIQQLLNITAMDGSGNMVPSPHFSVAGLNNMTSGSVSALQSSLVKADLCGARIHVVRSANPSLVHLSGLVVKESERTIIVAPPPGPASDQKDRAKRTRVIPKHNTVFAVHIPIPSTDTGRDQESVLFELHGNHMMHSLPSRATRKYKARATVDF